MFEVNVNGRKQKYRTKPTMNVDTTGSSGSIPKPLTYDYMPEGYPSKSVETVTLMEEQEVAFSSNSGLMVAVSPVAFELAEGDNLTVVWDGVNWDAAVTVRGGQYPAFGNLGLGDLGDVTDHPFMYLGQGGGNALWATTDTAASHTIKVTAAKTTYQTMRESFVPKSAFTKAEWNSIENRPIYTHSIDVALSAETMASVRVGSNYVELNVTVPDFNDGLFYKIEGEISFDNSASNIKYNIPISGYYKCVSSNSGKLIYLGSYYDSYHHMTLEIELCGGNSLLYPSTLHVRALPDGPGTSASYTITANLKFICEVKQLSEDYIPDTIQRTGNEVIIPSSTPDSTKRFKITVDDSGTLSATEVT